MLEKVIKIDCYNWVEVIKQVFSRPLLCHSSLSLSCTWLTLSVCTRPTPCQRLCPCHPADHQMSSHLVSATFQCFYIGRYWWHALISAFETAFKTSVPPVSCLLTGYWRRFGFFRAGGQLLVRRRSHCKFLWGKIHFSLGLGFVLIADWQVPASSFEYGIGCWLRI